MIGASEAEATVFDRKLRPLILFGTLVALALACNVPGLQVPTATVAGPAPSSTLAPTSTEASFADGVTEEPESSGAVDTQTPDAAPAPTPTPSPGSIGGIFWHDICEFTGGEGGEPVVLGLGCLMYGVNPEDFGANAVFDDYDEGFAGVKLHLGIGACPSAGLATATTDINGHFSFVGLTAGTYCVSYNVLTDGNDSILIPGGPTYPVRSDAGRRQSVALAAGEHKTDVDFGWQFQFGD